MRIVKNQRGGGEQIRENLRAGSGLSDAQTMSEARVLARTTINQTKTQDRPELSSFVRPQHVDCEELARDIVEYMKIGLQRDCWTQNTHCGLN